MVQHLAFVESQAASVESQVYMTKYPDIQYPMIVPVDTSAMDYADTVVHYSMNATGESRFLNNMFTDVPILDVTKDQHSVRIATIAQGYDYTMDEIGRAMLLGESLDADRAVAARRLIEEKIDDIVKNGVSDLGWDGFMDHSSITKANAVNGAGGSSNWVSKTALEVIKDITTMIGALWEGSKTVEMANTLLLPPSAYAHLVHEPYRDTNLMDWVMRFNIYTAQTGSPLMIREYRGLEDAAATNRGRAIAYRRAPDVLKLHMPRPLVFEAPQRWLDRVIVYAKTRLGGLEIRLPKACRYLDNITA